MRSVNAKALRYLPEEKAWCLVCGRRTNIEDIEGSLDFLYRYIREGNDVIVINIADRKLNHTRPAVQTDIQSEGRNWL